MVRNADLLTLLADVQAYAPTSGIHVHSVKIPMPHGVQEYGPLFPIYDPKTGISNGTRVAYLQFGMRFRGIEFLATDEIEDCMLKIEFAIHELQARPLVVTERNEKASAEGSGPQAG